MLVQNAAMHDVVVRPGKRTCLNQSNMAVKRKKLFALKERVLVSPMSVSIQTTL